jgi:hypothetical protein
MLVSYPPENTETPNVGPLNMEWTITMYPFIAELTCILSPIPCTKSDETFTRAHWLSVGVFAAQIIPALPESKLLAMV